MSDELDQIRRFRADVPAPSQDAEQTARGALMEAIAGGREAKPPKPRRGGSKLALVPALLAAAAVAVIVIAAVRHGGARPARPAGPVLRSGQYLYVDSRAVYESDSGSCVVEQPQHRRIWIGADGSGRILETFGRGHYTSAADAAACRRAHVGLGGGSGFPTAWFARGCLSISPTDDWAALSSNPRTLRRQLYRVDGGSPSPGEDFTHVGDLLRETPAPYRVRLALYRMALTIRGAHRLGIQRDHAGRRGLAVALGDSELVFARGSYQLLGEQTGTSSWAVYLHREIVDRIPGRAPPLGPLCGPGGSGRMHQTGRGTVMNGAGVRPAPGLVPRVIVRPASAPASPPPAR